MSAEILQVGDLVHFLGRPGDDGPPREDFGIVTEILCGPTREGVVCIYWFLDEEITLELRIVQVYSRIQKIK